MDISKREIFRYLGYGRSEPDVQTMQLVDYCMQEIQNVLSCKFLYRMFPVKLEEDTISFADIQIHSKNLAKNLQGCSEIIVFAATLGSFVDRLLARFSKMQMSKAAVFQATATTYIEQYCDDCQKNIAQEVHAQNRYLRPRFSPGYGDFSIEHQTDLLRLLDTPKRMGLTLTQGMALAPEKSVTAVMGVSRADEKCHISGCEACVKYDCPFRRNTG